MGAKPAFGHELFLKVYSLQLCASNDEHQKTGKGLINQRDGLIAFITFHAAL